MESEGGEIQRRVQVILLSGQRQQVQDIAVAVRLHPINVRKWIGRFNRIGPEGLRERQSPGRPRKFDDLVRLEIERVARELGRTSLNKIRQAVIEQGVVDDISLEEIRIILNSRGVHWS